MYLTRPHTVCQISNRAVGRDRRTTINVDMSITSANMVSLRLYVGGNRIFDDVLLNCLWTESF